MKAAILRTPKQPLNIDEIPKPSPVPGQVLLRVRACGVCRTDLHIVEGELPQRTQPLIPGHQIVGDVVEGATAELPTGTRVGVSWMGGVDGTCPYCRRGMENLCDSPAFTGYTINGGYAEYAVARADFIYPLPPELDDLHAAPLLCAGIIGFRSLRVAGVEPGDCVWASSVSGHRLIWQSRFCTPGSAKCTSRRAAPPIESWLLRWELPGLEVKTISHLLNSIVR